MNLFQCIICLPVAVLSCIEVGAANAAVIVKEKTTVYQVEGKTGRELIRGFKADKSQSEYSYLKSNSRPIAHVHFEVEVTNVRKKYSAHNCFIRDVDVVINAHYLYPEWKDKKQGSRELQRTWQEFKNYAVWHEKHHVEITKQYARDYINLLKKTKFALLGDCNVMPKATKRTVAQLQKQLNTRQKKFDRDEARIGGRSYKLQSKLRRTK